MRKHEDSSASVDVDIESNRRRNRKKSSKAARRNREPSDGNLSEVSSRDEPIGDERTGVDNSTSATDDRTNSSEVESSSRKKNGKSGTLVNRLIRVAICFLLLLAIVLLIFTALSTPVIKPLYLFSLRDKDDSGDKFTFGIWGYCWPAIKLNIDGGSAQAYDEGCRGGMVGWTLANVPGLADESDSVKHALTGAFLINVLVILILILTLLSSAVAAAVPDMLVSKSESRTDSAGDASSVTVDDGSTQSNGSGGNTRKRKREEESGIDPDGITSESYVAGPSQDQISSGRRRMSALVAVGAIFSLFFMVVVFFFDLGALLQIRHNVDNASGLEFDFGWGPAFWFVLAAFVLVILACLLAFVDMFLTVTQNPKSTDKKKGSSDDMEGANSQPESGSRSMAGYGERSEKESGARRPTKTTRTDSMDSEEQMVDIDLHSDVESRRPRAHRSKSDKSRRKKR